MSSFKLATPKKAYGYWLRTVIFHMTLIDQQRRFKKIITRQMYSSIYIQKV